MNARILTCVIGILTMVQIAIGQDKQIAKPDMSKEKVEAQVGNEVKKDTRGYIVEVGDTSPEFEIELDNGDLVKSEDFHGKVVMLQFTASWCGVCRKEMPFIEEEIWKLHKDDDFVLIGVDRDEPLEKVLKLKEQTKVTYPLGLDHNADIFGLFANKKSGVTRNVILDKSGKIIMLTRLFDRTEFDEMKDVIAKALLEELD